MKTMKNESISRVILILEIGAIILFHSLKNSPPANDKIVRDFSEPHQVTLNHSTQVVLTAAK